MTGLTPAQRRKQNRETRRAQNGLWAETMGPVPYHLSQGCAALGSNTGACVQEKIDRAPAHMVDTDAFTIDQTKQVALSAKASACRTDERAQRIAEIRSELPHLWGIRGSVEIYSTLRYLTTTGVALTPGGLT